MEAEALGENRMFTLLKHGPTTSPTSGSDSTTNSISLDASFNGDPPTATISQSNTVTVDSTDFRAIDNTSAKKTSTRYYLAFSQDGGELKDIKDLVILRHGVRAGVAELPNRAKTGFPIISHGLWRIDKRTISVGVRLKVKATLAKMFRKSQVTGFDHRVTIQKQVVTFDKNITIPAVRLRY